MCNLPTNCHRVWADCRTKALALAVDITTSHRSGPATVRWHDAPRGGIHVHVIAPLTFDVGLAGLQPLYEQFALVVEDLQIKVDRRDREQIACTGMPEAPGAPAA